MGSRTDHPGGEKEEHHAILDEHLEVPLAKRKHLDSFAV